MNAELRKFLRLLLVSVAAGIGPTVASAETLDLRAAEAPAQAGPALRSAHLVGRRDPSVHRALVGRARGAEVVRGTLDQLMALAARGEGRVELARPLWPDFAEGLATVGVETTAPRRETLGVDGSGVLIGIVDTGIDWRHVDFLDASGHTRVLWLLDLGLSPREGAHPTVDSHGGAVWSSEEIQEALGGSRALPSTDSVGHGTFIAGIAASSGADGFGVASGAQLVVVKASRGAGFGFDDATVLEGVDFIVERADALGLPVVINLSLGGHIGPHNGQTLFERGLRQRMADRPGRALVVSAGNSGGSDIHASGRLNAHGSVSLAVEIPFEVGTDQGTGAATIEFWYRNLPDAPVRVSVSSPAGGSVLQVGGGETGVQRDSNAGTLVIAHLQPDADGLQGALITIQQPQQGPLAAGIYTLEVEGGGGRFDAWVADDGGFGARLRTHLDPDVRLGVPCTVDGAICVGSYTSSGGWLSLSGPQSLEVRLGEASYFSGTGPTGDGRAKPDLLAPGFVVASSMASAADPAINSQSMFSVLLPESVDPVLADGTHAVSQGTSASTPFVVGAAALLLEQEPSRTAGDLRDLLRASAIRPERGTHTLWHPRAGFGLLQIPAALELGAGRAAGGPVSPAWSDAGLTRDLIEPGGSEGTTLFVRPRSELGAAPPVDPATIEVSARCEAGQLAIGGVEPGGPWLRRVAINAGNARGRCLVQIWVGGIELDVRPTLSVVDSRGELGLADASVRGGACQASPALSRPPSAPLTVLAAAMLLMGLARRKSSRTAERFRRLRDRSAAKGRYSRLRGRRP